MNKLKSQIIDLSEEVMEVLGPGYKESVYERALAHELRLQGIPYERQSNIEITYKGYYLKDVLSDIIVKGSLLLELKANKTIGKPQIKQAQVYMFSLDIKDGLVVSFSGDGEVLSKDVEMPVLTKPESKVKKAYRSKGKIKVEKILKESVKEIMERFGVEFMFTDAKFDMYVKALSVDLSLRNIDYKKAEAPVYYKNQEVEKDGIEFVLNDNTGIYPFSYNKEEQIEEETQNVKNLKEILNLECVRLVGFPKKETLDTVVKEIK